jgi:hypothetical protein
MHDLIRDMGREIVRKRSAKEPGKRSRLWIREDVYDVLTKHNVRTSITLHYLIKITRHSFFFNYFTVHNY